MYIRRFTWSKEDKSIEECFTLTGILPGGLPDCGELAVVLMEHLVVKKNQKGIFVLIPAFSQASCPSGWLSLSV